MNYIQYILLLFAITTSAQSGFTIKGHFNGVANQQFTLKGFNAREETTLDKSTSDAHGNFTLTYPADYTGAALLEITKGKKVIILLNHENFEIHWADLNVTKSLKFLNSPENSAFDSGLALYQNVQEKKAGISYLLPYYLNDSQKSQFFKTELSLLNAAMPDYLNKLSDQSYASYYLKIRSLIADFPLSLKRYPERFPELEQKFNALNFADERLLHSGLYAELLETYVISLENHYGQKKSEHLNNGIKSILDMLKSMPGLKQDTAEYLFNLLEKRSLFESSEFLALAMLTDDSCHLDDKHKALFEQYRKMAKGNTAPDIIFNNAQKLKLSDLRNKYKLVVFGAGWCPKCVEEIPKFKAFYADWKKNFDLEIIFISLDTEKKEYENFVKDFPWLLSCDFAGWESKTVTDYCVFATPTIYLLDAYHKIMLKPITADQVNAWLEMHR